MFQVKPAADGALHDPAFCCEQRKCHVASIRNHFHVQPKETYEEVKELARDTVGFITVTFSTKETRYLLFFFRDVPELRRMPFSWRGEDACVGCRISAGCDAPGKAMRRVEFLSVDRLRLCRRWLRSAFSSECRHTLQSQATHTTVRHSCLQHRSANTDEKPPWLSHDPVFKHVSCDGNDSMKLSDMAKGCERIEMELERRIGGEKRKNNPAFH